MRDPLQHVRVGGKEFHQLVSAAQANCLLPQSHQLIGFYSPTHILVDLGKLSDLLPRARGVIEEEGLDPLYAL